MNSYIYSALIFCLLIAGCKPNPEHKSELNRRVSWNSNFKGKDSMPCDFVWTMGPKDRFVVCAKQDTPEEKKYVKNVLNALNQSFAHFTKLGYDAPEMKINDKIEVWIQDTEIKTVKGMGFPSKKIIDYIPGAELLLNPAYEPYINEPHMFIQPKLTEATIQSIVAHELFHLIQFRYVKMKIPIVNKKVKFFWENLGTLWVLESTASQMAEEVFPNRKYLTFEGANIFAKSPTVGLQEEAKDKPYSGVLFFRFLSEKYNSSRALQETFRKFHAIKTHKQFLTDYLKLIDPKLKLVDVFKEFWVWNYFVGSRVKFGFESYSDASSLSPPPFPDSLDKDSYITYKNQETDSFSKIVLKKSSAKLQRIKFEQEIPSKSIELSFRDISNNQCGAAFAITTNIEESEARLISLQFREGYQNSFKSSHLKHIDIITVNGCFGMFSNLKDLVTYTLHVKVLTKS